MPVKLTHFSIEGLHGNRNFNIPIIDNRLILVGENGMGKSTVANFIFFCLTQLWDRMVTYDFAAVNFTINSQEIALTKKDIMLLSGFEPSSERSRRFRAEVPNRVMHEMRLILQENDPFRLIDDPRFVEQLAIQNNIAPSILLDYLFNMVSVSSEEKPISDKLRNIIKKLNSAVTEQILYLPTYRRIEKELKFIFPRLDIEDMRHRSRMLPRRRGEEAYLELVEFGMQDVEQLIKEKMLSLKEELRRDLNNLTGNYLREVIQGAYGRVKTAALRDLEPQTISDIFNRVGESLLSENEKESLREILSKIDQGEKLKDKDKVVAHFLTRLIELHKRQQDNEKSVQEFVRVCNAYLKGKELAFDNSKFEIHVTQTVTTQEPNANKSQDLEMISLSSGEKQIVSLFSHVYLSGKRGYFVVIDEPELSLSVPWQRRFLPDILNSGKCNGLIAVTHSPFIFENDLDQYAHSLDEYMVVNS